MIERSYTVKEIDRMREAVGNIIVWKHGRSYGEYAEICLRTYMMAGISPEELELEEKETQIKYYQIHYANANVSKVPAANVVAPATAIE